MLIQEKAKVKKMLIVLNFSTDKSTCTTNINIANCAIAADQL
jgi:hypothetical protein